MVLFFLRIADFFYSIFLRIGFALNMTPAVWAEALSSGRYQYGVPIAQFDNPFYDFITSAGGTAVQYVYRYDNDLNTVYIIWKVMTAPIQLLGNLASILSDALSQLGLAPLPLNLDITTLPMWVGIIIGSLFWGSILFVVKFLTKATLH